MKSIQISMFILTPFNPNHHHSHLFTCFEKQLTNDSKYYFKVLLYFFFFLLTSETDLTETIFIIIILFLKIIDFYL